MKAGAGRVAWGLAAPLLGLAAAAIVAGPPAVAAPGSTGARAYLDEPPPGFSGGFGEDSCQACHFSAEVNEEPGDLLVRGLPERYAPGELYPLTITLIRPGMAMGGFQFTARYEEGGAQAGDLSPALEEEDRVTVASSFDIQYAQHRRAGTELVAADTARWVVLWRAPPRGGAVLFHAAANAADGDDSASGDYVYTAVEASTPEREGRAFRTSQAVSTPKE